MRFGVFEVDLPAGQLRRHGRRIPLPEQPLQILCALLERPGEVVTREELRRRLWPAGVHVDFERGLNKAVLKLRETLGDIAENPRFIETVPRRGYRFIAPVTPSAPGTVTGAPTTVQDEPEASPRRGRLVVAGAVGTLLLTAGVVLWRMQTRPAAKPSLVRFTVRLPAGLGFNVYNSASIAFSHDGTRIAYAARGVDGGGIHLRALDGLEVTRLPGTQRARSPFFAMDDTWIGFEAGEKLKRVAVTGGTPKALGDLPFPAGATAAGPEGSIVVVPSFTGGLFRLPNDGGRPSRLTRPDRAQGGGAHVWPAALPTAGVSSSRCGRVTAASTRPASPCCPIRRASPASSWREATARVTPRPATSSSCAAEPCKPPPSTWSVWRRWGRRSPLGREC
jgi:DNA-binding winged helix-turn-helix (wHTH) protein